VLFRPTPLRVNALGVLIIVLAAPLAFVTDAWWAVILGGIAALVGIYLAAAVLVGFYGK
jgi:hypothetical protein